MLPDNRLEGDTPTRQAQLVMLSMLKAVEALCASNGISYWLSEGTLIGAVRHKGFIPWDDDLDICMMREDFDRFREIAPALLPASMFMQCRESDPAFRDGYIKIRDNYSTFLMEGEGRQEYHQGIFLDIFPMDYYAEHPAVFRAARRIKLLTKILSGRDAALHLNEYRRLRFYLILMLRPLRLLPLRSLRRLMKKRFLARSRRLLGVVDGRVINYGPELDWYVFLHPSEVFPLTRLPFEDGSFPAPSDWDAVLRRQYGDYMTPPKYPMVHGDSILPAVPCGHPASLPRSGDV